MAKTILLVDDDIDLLHSLSELLRKRGYSVLEHSDPREALEYCREKGEDLNCVLTDIDMPGMDGISFLAEVHRMHPVVEGLLMTGNLRWVAPASSDGLECLQKPFTYAELFLALEKRTTTTQ